MSATHIAPPRWHVIRLAVAGFAVAVGLLASVSALAFWSFRETVATGTLRGHALQALAQAERVLGLIRDAETGQRGFLLTGDASYLAPYDHARKRLPDELTALRRLLSEEGTEQDRVFVLGRLVGEKMDELAQTIALRRAQGLDAARAIIDSRDGEDAMDAIRRVIADIQYAENEQSEKLFAERNASARRTALGIASVSGLTALIVMLSGFGLVRQTWRRTRAERAVRESRRRLAVLLASIGDGVVATDTGGCVTFMNRVAERFTGWTERDALGKPLATVLHMADDGSRATASDPVATVVRDGVADGQAERALLVGRDGAECPIESTAAPIRGDDGRVEGVVVVFRDVSEQTAGEQARARYARAEAANQAKDEFLAVVSHELRSPLNAMLGWVKLMEREPSPDVVRRAVEVLERNVRSQAELINGLLDVSRIVTGKLHLERSVLDLRVVVLRVVEAMRASAAEKGIALECTVGDAGPLCVTADEERLQQVFRNLVGNALKFTPPGGSVSITVTHDAQAARVAVADTGEGIAADFLPHVFERFRQSGTGTARRHGGLGLGLAIVDHLVRRHGGTVEVASDGPGTGACFTVTLPLALDAEIEAATAVARAEDGLPRVTVLLVEDDADTLEAFRRVLEDHGARVVAARGAGDALGLLGAESPAVIVSDISMPDMDGYAFIRAVRDREDGRTPAIAVTSLASGQDRDDALRAGFDEHLPKPVDPFDLVRLVRAMAASGDAARVADAS